MANTQPPPSGLPLPANRTDRPQESESLASRRLFLAVALVGLAALLGHRWIALAWNAARYPVAAPAARTQVVVLGDRAYLAAGIDGLEVVDLTGRNPVRRTPPPAGTDRIDDLVLADGILFALDATPPGNLTAFSLADPDRPMPGGAVSVPVGPFSGVSAAAGRVAVSGGTSQLTLREYDSAGRLGAEVATADFGRGQPDVALRADGKLAAISTHLYGPEFAITLAEIRRHPLRLVPHGHVRLPEAGFTSGGFKPAHFPLVSVWQGSRLYVAAGGGLSVIDASNPTAPRLLAQDPISAPAIDLVIEGNELDVLRAGARPAVLRYRLAPSGLPLLFKSWSLPPGSLPAALARHGSDLLVTLRGQSFRLVTPGEFSTVRSVQP